MKIKNKQILENLKNGIGIEQFSKDYYLLGEDEVVNKYNISHGSVRLLKKQFNLSKPKPNRYNVHKAQNNKQQLLQTISKDDLYKIYIEQNKNWDETCLYFNISKTKLAYLIKFYKLNKDKERHNLLAKQTKLRKYGNSNYNNPNKIRETCLTRYGVSNWHQKDIYHYDIWSNKNKFIAFLNQLPNKPTIDELSEYFNIDRTNIFIKIDEYDLRDFCKFYLNRSHYEDEIIEFLNNIGITNIQTNIRGLLSNNLEIDIYLPDYKLGIEFNGNYWHSDIVDKFKDHNGRSLYHQYKSLNALEHNIFLFHIFEYEWNNPNKQEQIKQRLKTILSKNNIKIPARKCSIIELTKEQKKTFLNNNHIQGNDHSTKYFGLLYKDEVVACMTFIHPKSNKYTWELSRFCNKKGINVQGGASKLFKYFVQQLNIGDTIVSFNDITKTKGDLYKILGFEQKSINAPNYIWINFKTGDIRTRYQEQASGEVKRMHNQDYHRICDCGTITWVFKKKALIRAFLMLYLL